MFHTKLTDGVTNVGVLNPNMRVFDVIMKTEYGTSYNAYLVQGTEKTALIETVHKEFLDYLLANLGDIMDVPKIDYLIMNHNEPDHSGAIQRLLDVYPDLTIVVSKAGSIYLKNITNRSDYQCMVVKDGDKLELGGKTLTFYNAPFLHWPDSMFTYLEENKVLFSCDFLGAHYCEPQMIDNAVRYQAEYEEAFRGYYDAIFGPFMPYVRKGLEIVDRLELSFIAPSHGPVLTKGIFLEAAVAKYEQWSKQTQAEIKSIPVFYCSAYGNTRMLAQSIAAGILEAMPDARVTLYDVIQHDMPKLAGIMNECDAFLIGSPTINKDAVAPVNVLLAYSEAINMAKRPVAVFGSYGWSGEAFGTLKARLTTLKTNLFPDELKVVFVPTEEDLVRAREYGKSFVSFAF